MNTPSDLQNIIIPLLATTLRLTQNSQYDVIYEPSYDPVFFYSEEDEYEEYYEEDWDDFFPRPDSSGIGQA